VKLGKLALTLILLTGCPNQEDPPPDGGIPDGGGPNPQLIVEPDPSTLSLVEGEPAAMFLVRLSEDPQRSIAASFTVADPSVLTIDPAAGSLDSTNFQGGVTVTLRPLDDDDAANDVTDITVTTDVGTETYTVTVVDDDAPNLVVTPLQISVVEGDAGTFEVRFSSPPADTVAVSVRSSDGARATVSPTTLSFDGSNWMTAQTVTVTSFDDVDLADDAITVDLDNPAGEDATVSVTVTDDDGQAFVLTRTEITVVEGNTATVGVSLAFAPAADVTVSVASSSAFATVDVTTLTFTPIDSMLPKTVTITTLDDPNVEAETATITFSSPDVPVDGTVEVTITDDDTQIIEVTTSSVTVTETGTTTLGVRLGFAPPADVMVTLALSDPSKIGASPSVLTFTGANWDQFQDVTVAGVLDLDTDDELEDITLTAPGAGAVTVSVAVADDDVQAILADAPFVLVDEGGVAGVGITLAYQPSTDVTVSVASLLGAFTTDVSALTFTPLDYDVPQMVTLTGVQDQNAGDESDSLELASPAAGMLSVPVTVVEDDVQAVVVSAASITVIENGFTTFDVSLAYQPAAGEAVAITPADAFIGANPTALVFTAADWNVAQTVTITALDDANVLDEQSSVSVGSAALAPVTVQVLVMDDDVQAIVLDTNALAVAENGVATFMVSLAFQPAAPVTLSIASSDAGAASATPAVLMFDSTNFATPQAVDVTGADDADTANETATLTVSGTGLTDATVTISVTDDDVQALILTRTTVAMTEGTTDTVGVSLAFMPAGDVTVSIASSDPAVTAAPATVTITPAGYQTPQVVTLTAAGDADTANETAAVTFSSAGLADAIVDVTVTDDDVQSLVVTPAAMSVTEGGSDNLFVSLAFEPAGTVNVSIVSSDPTLAQPQLSVLTFDATSYATPQAVAVAGIQDADVEDESVDVVVSSAGLADVTVTVAVVDDDILNLDVNPTSLTLTEGGAAGTFGVQLTQQPAAPLTVAITPSVAGVVTLSAAALDFDTTNWNVAQNVTVSPADDADALDESVTLTVSTAGLTPRTVAVTVADDDTQAIVLDTNALALTEGAGGALTVRLAADPVTPVTVTIASSDPGAVGISAATLTFDSATYDVPQTLDVTAIDDADTRDESAVLTFTAPVAATETVTVAVTDDDVQAILASAAALTVTEGMNGTFTVRLAFDPVTPVTVGVAISDPAVATAAPVTLAFDSTSWSVPQTVTVSALADTDTADDTATITLSSAVAPDVTVALIVDDDDVQAILVSANALALDENGTGTFTVALAFDPITPQTITLANPDTGAIMVPASLTFDSATYAVPQTVTVAALDDDDALDESVTLTLSGAGAPVGPTVVVSVADDDTQAILVSTTETSVDEGQSTTITVRLAFDPVTPAIVSVVSSDPGAATALPAMLTFTSADYDQPQTVTITGVQDVDLADESVLLTLSAPIANDVTVDVSVNDEDVQALVLNTTALTVPEGGSRIFRVSLAFQPAANVVVNVVSNDTTVATLNRASMTFTPASYATPQIVRVFGAQDIDLADEATTVDVTSVGIAPAVVSITVEDEDVQAFVLNPANVMVNEGATAAFDVSLMFQPAGPVAAALLSSDTGAATVQPALMFDATNFATPQSVPVTGVQDDDTRDETPTITLSSADVPAPGTVLVSVNDDDVQALLVTPVELTVVESGEVDVFSVRFAFEPDGPTIVTITSNDPGAAGVNPAQLTFDPTNYTVPQFVDVSGVADADVVGEIVDVDVATAVAATETVVVTVIDDDTQAIQPSAGALTVVEDTGPGSFTVRLAFMPQADTTVTLTPANGSVAVNPASVTFTPQNYAIARTIAVSGTTDLDQVDAGAVVTLSAAGIADATVTITVIDDDDQRIIVSANTVQVDEEDTTTFTVRLAFIPLAPLETITLTSADPLAATVLPLTIGFTAATYATPVTVTAMGVTDEDILDESVTVTLSSSDGGTPNATVTVDVNDIDIQDIVLSQTTLSLVEGGQPSGVTVSFAQDPSGSQDITVASLDPQAVSAAPGTLAFDSGNYTVGQPVTIGPVDDDDVRDETVTVRFTSPAVTTRTVTVDVADDDTQAILVSARSVSVTEGAGVTFDVSLAFRPTNPVIVTVVAADPGIATALPAQLTFDAATYATPQPVTAGGTQDGDLDDESTSITLSTGALAPPEGAADVTVTVDVIDDDQQVIVAANVPATLGTSVQEGGPGVAFEVSLGFPPRLNQGGTSVVDISSSLQNLSFNPSSITFDTTSFDVPVQVVVTAGDDLNETTELVDVDLQIAEEVSGTHQVQIVDDEITVLTNTTYPGLDGGTLFTRRQNIGWGTTRLALTGFDAAGATRIASNTRELDDAVTGPAIAAGGGGPLSAESVDFDGTAFSYFVTSAGGIQLARSDETAAATFFGQNVAGAGALNFWPAFAGGDRFGLVFREDGVVSDRLRMRTVDTDGTLGTSFTLTIVDGSDDVQPNAHFNGTGYTVLYSSATEVRCLRTNAQGALIAGSDMVLPGFPAGGAFVSSVMAAGAIVAAFYDATNSINVAEIDPDTCAVNTTTQVGGANVFFTSPPSIAWNGTELAIAYDFLMNSVEQVGVLLVTPGLAYRDDYVVGGGSRPSIAWAGDRWALRHGNPVVVTVGSFQTLCADGLQSPGEDDVDCGGSCPPCVGD
jgi:hypothetical protein